MYYMDKVVLLMTLKDNLKVFREQAGYKQAKEFAKFAGIPYSSYSAYERGSWPNEENLVKLATALNVSVDTLIGFKQGQVDKIQQAINELKACHFTVEVIDRLPDEPGEGPLYHVQYEGKNNFVSNTGFTTEINLEKKMLIGLYEEVNSNPGRFTKTIIEMKEKLYKQSIDSYLVEFWATQKNQFITSAEYRDFLYRNSPQTYDMMNARYGALIKK